MGKSRHPYDTRIAHTVEDGLDQLGQLFTHRWDTVVVPPCNEGDTIELACWCADLSRVIRVCPDKVTGVQIVLNDLGNMDPETWVSKASKPGSKWVLGADALKDWIRELEDDDQLVVDDKGRIIITLPLPYDNDSGSELLRPPVRSRHDRSVCTAELVLWSAYKYHPSFRLYAEIALKAPAIHSFRFVKGVPYTPAFHRSRSVDDPPDQMRTELDDWPSWFEWYLTSHQFDHIYSKNSSGPDNSDGTSTFWVPVDGPLLEMTVLDLGFIPTLKTAFIVRTEEPSPLDSTPADEPRLFKISRPATWPQKRDWMPLIRAYGDARQGLSGPSAFEVFSGESAIIKELMKH